MTVQVIVSEFILVISIKLSLMLNIKKYFEFQNSSLSEIKTRFKRIIKILFLVHLSIV